MNEFNWDDFESMVSNNPTAVGLELEDYYFNPLREYPYSNNEMDEKIKEYLNDSEPTAWMSETINHKLDVIKQE